MEQQTLVKVAGGTAGVVVVALVLIAAVADVAAQAPGPNVRSGAHADGRGAGRPGGPGGPGRGAFGLNLRSLTDAQREQIRAVVESHREEMRGLVARERTARQALRASAESGQVDESQASELGSAVASLAVARARVHAEMIQLLTPEQRQELQTRREAMKSWLEARPGGRGRRDQAPQQ